MKLSRSAITTLCLLFINLNIENSYATETGNDFIEDCRYVIERGEEEYNNPQHVQASTKCIIWFRAIWDGITEGAGIGYAAGLEDSGFSHSEAWKKALIRNNSPIPILGFCISKYIKDPIPSDNRSELQLFRIVYKYIDDHPEEASDPASVLVIRSMMRAFPCEGK